MHTQYIAANARGREIGATDFLIDKLIHKFKREGFHRFSFGISNNPDGSLNKGLHQWKLAFGAKEEYLKTYTIEL